MTESLLRPKALLLRDALKSEIKRGRVRYNHACGYAKMKTILCLLLLFIAAIQIQADEVSLYDSNGNAVAYIDTDDEYTIYTWAGSPVAYLKKDSIYSFEGKHLGWLSKGVIRDHDGNVAGFLKGAITNVMLQLENLKGLKQLKPLKQFPELEPMKPMWTIKFSPTPLSLFFSSSDN